MAQQPTIIYEDLELPNNFAELTRKRENKLRFYFVDGELVQIPRDGMEPLHVYRHRTTYVLSRSFNPKQRIEELTLNARIDANKRWAPTVVDEETSESIQLPYYPDAIEARYKNATKLPAFDSKLSISIQETIKEESKIVEIPKKEIEEEKQEPEPQQEEEPEEEPKHTYTITKKDNSYVLESFYPLFITLEGSKKHQTYNPTNMRLSKTNEQIMAPVFNLYTAKLSGRIGNIGQPTIQLVGEDTNANGLKVVIIATFPTQQTAEKAYNRISESINTLKPLDTNINGLKGKLHYHVSE